MIRFLIKILLFWLLFIGLVFSITYYQCQKVVKGKQFQNHNNEESLIITPKNEHFDYLILGISHARNFSRHHNHQRVESILEVNMLNYGKGAGKGSIANQHNFFKYFLSRHNSADNIFYVITMPMFFSNIMDANAYTYENEIFSPKFFFILLFGPEVNKGEKMYNYLRSKYNTRWKKYGTWSANINENALSEIDTAAISNGFRLAYVKGLEMDAFERNKRYLIKTIELAQKNGINISFLITPTLFGEWPGHDMVIKFLDELEQQYNVKTYNFCCVYLDKVEYFADHHHLNTPGVIAFTEEYLKPIVEENKNKNQKDSNR
jgi:hypothetical protein